MPSRQQSPRPAKSRRPQRSPGAQGTQGTHGVREAQWSSEAHGTPEAHGVPEAQWPPEARGTPAAYGTPEAQWPPGTQSALEAGWPAEAQWPGEAQWPPDIPGDREAEGTLEVQGAPDASPWGPEAEDPDASPRGPEGPEDPEAAARQICLRLLTIEPRSRSQLAEALRRQHIPGPAAEAVLDRFTEAGLIDDPAFARAWVESRHHSRGLSRRALSAELHRRGLADEDVHNAIELVDDDQEAATARRLIAGKVRATRGQPSMARVRKLMGVLARKGYGAALAYRVVREALEAEGAEIAADIAEPDLDIGPEDSSCLPHRSHLEKRSPEAAGHRPPHAGLKSR